MRFVLRLLLMLALLLSGTSLSPAAATDAARSVSGRQAMLVRAPVASAVTITSAGGLRRLMPTTVGVAAFRYSAPRVPGTQFQCRLTGPGQRGIWRQRCPVTSRTDRTVTGAMSYRRLTANPRAYTFTVQAYLPAVVAGGKVVTPRSNGRPASFSWYIYSMLVRDRYVPLTGLHFNSPLAGRRSLVRTNLTHVIRTINSMPGFREPYRTNAPCRSVSVSRIRISLYSLTDQPVANALVAAAKRCVSVQVLMNNHLSSATDPAWHRLESTLRPNVFSRRVPRPSFAHRCSFGCLGSGVLHTKMYLFDSNAPAPRSSWNRVKKTVITGSSNMTFNAAKVQWNDLYTARNNARLYSQFGAQFDRMKRDSGFRRTPPLVNGNYRTVFWPTRVGTDPYLSELRSIRCTGARGAGIRGHSIVYINMHAWFGTRGLAIARQVRGMYNRGCYVRVLYGFMSFGVYTILHRNTGGRMSVRRTVFSHDGRSAYIYSHFKNIAVSGVVGRARNARVAWTGSNNFTNDGTHFDEVMLRINSASVYNAYVRQFTFMRNRMSSATYANFSEPRGGGRAPRALVQRQFGVTQVPAGELDELEAPPGTPTITSPGITVDANGQPHALD